MLSEFLIPSSADGAVSDKEFWVVSGLCTMKGEILADLATIDSEWLLKSVSPLCVSGNVKSKNLDLRQVSLMSANHFN